MRATNEDSMFVDDAHGVFVVADGMGGHAAGEVASQMAAERVGGKLSELHPSDEGAVRRGLLEAIERANLEILERAARETDKRGMGTTLTILVLLPPSGYVVGQVGDSRAYLWREGRLEQLTKDHTVVQEQVDRGLLTDEEARGHPLSHMLTRALGARANVEVDLVPGSARPGDLFLLASDGLCGLVSDEEIADVLSAHRGRPLSQAVEALVEAANREGGYDNVTVLLVHILPED